MKCLFLVIKRYLKYIYYHKITKPGSMGLNKPKGKKTSTLDSLNLEHNYKHLHNLVGRI